MNEDVALKPELDAAIAARKELGDEMEPAVIDAFVARIEGRLAGRADAGERALKRKRDHQKEMVLGSMGIRPAARDRCGLHRPAGRRGGLRRPRRDRDRVGALAQGPESW